MNIIIEIVCKGERMKDKKIKKRIDKNEKNSSKKKLIIVSSILLFIIISIIGVALFINIHGLKSKLSIKLIGKDNIKIEVGSDYKDKGSTAKYDKNDLSKKIKVKGKVNNKKLGEYELVYNIKYKKLSKQVKRKVKVVDTKAPDINLTGEAISIIVGNDYKEPGFSAEDNYDGNITDKVKVENNIDKNKIGKYEVTYTVKDSSNNEKKVTREVSVIAKPVNSKGQGVAVLNYHFFYDKSIGQSCGDSICEEISQFKSHLNYLKQNGYKTLTMKEFRDWMYGYTEIPEKSVLITVDDGAAGTGKHNGNLLIPALEEYQAHATLFLITGWWDISNYTGSKYLEVHSHTNDMHVEGLCTGVSRGAQMLCKARESEQSVLDDLQKSIDITKSKTAFCFPFYAYDATTIKLVKQAGFELAFIGGSRKARRSDDKWHIPRYPIVQSHTLQDFINMVS